MIRAEALRPALIATHPSTASTPDMNDNDYRTAWTSGGSQTGSEMISATLGEPRAVTGVEMALGPHHGAFARALAVDVSQDGQVWKRVATANGSIVAFEAAMRDARVVPVTIRFDAERASHVRISQTGQSRAHWAVAELRVLANNK